MKIQLIDTNIKMCEYWKQYFNVYPEITIYNGDFFSLPTDCVVSPANSFGFMDGGLDLAISQKLGWGIQEKLQKQIQKDYDGELLVGQAELVETGHSNIPYLISAPTMRVPAHINNTVNVYLAARAIFSLVRYEECLFNPRFNTVTISGLGTGVGRVTPDSCAKQMFAAYDRIIKNNNTFPRNWEDVNNNHNSLI